MPQGLYPQVSDIAINYMNSPTKGVGDNMYSSLQSATMKKRNKILSSRGIAQPQAQMQTPIQTSGY